MGRAGVVPVRSERRDDRGDRGLLGASVRSPVEASYIIGADLDAFTTTRRPMIS